MSFKSKVTISNDLIELFDNGGLRKAAATQIAEMVKEEFNTMLLDAPQYSGNYVANMRLGTSGIARQSADLPFDPNPSLESAYRRGQLTAVNIAQEKSSQFIPKAIAHIQGKGGWLREIVVYNPLKYAGAVEENPKLRSENRGGEHALAKMADRLSRRHTLLDLRRVK